jgi:hypothetical protein
MIIVERGRAGFHEEVADIHGFHHDGVRGIVCVDALVDAGFDGGEESILVRGLDLKTKQNGYEEAIQKHKEVKIPEQCPNKGKRQLHTPILELEILKVFLENK